MVPSGTQVTQVAVLAKAPIEGRAKTRLASQVGPERALAAYRAVGELVVGRVALEVPVCVWFDPPGAEADMRSWLGEDLEFRPQPRGDLGRRIAYAFDRHFSEGAERVLAIGADAPGVDATTIRSAVRGLDVADVVLGPAFDGGYYLIGLRAPCPELFRSVPWSTADVLRITLETCEKRHLRTCQLEPLRDLDGAADLAALGLDR